MRKTLLFFLFFSFFFSWPVLGQMTDEQVIEYVKGANASGKSETEISRELLSKGVTVDQVNRLKKKYSENNENLKSEDKFVSKQRRQPNRYSNSHSVTDTVGMKQNERQIKGQPLEDQPYNPDYFYPEQNYSEIYGHDIFFRKDEVVSFEPNENVATPVNYKLGSGDEVVIEIWGSSEATIRETITPEGKINISQVGPIYLSGLSIKDAEAKVKRVLATKYSSLDNLNSSNVSVSLGAIRTVLVNVMGDVNYPGSYRLSSFSTVFSALYNAGGVTEIGSLRAVQLVRGGEKVATVDIYEYIIEGKSSSDMFLQDGDVIIVPSYINVVEVKGGVKRPMKYEMADGETVSDLIRYAGGMSGRAFKDNVSVLRLSSDSRNILTASKSDGYNVPLEDGDVVTVGVNDQHFDNRLEIQGYVVNPGEYQYGDGISTVKELVYAAGGLKADAFMNRAVLHRENRDKSFETLSVNIGGIMDGTCPDIKLRKGDILTVSGIFEISDRGILTINGMVANPGIFDFSENTTIEDLIMMAGGLKDGASMSKVDVSRRVMDSHSTQSRDTVGLSYSFSIKDGLVVDGGDSFYLQPYDVVSVRSNPTFHPQKFVKIQGEVTFPGDYVLQYKGERVSSLIKRAGGLNSIAYLRGAKLTRKMSEEEIYVAKEYKRQEYRHLQKQKEKTLGTQAMENDLDTLDMNDIVIPDTYVVAVDFEKALANPGSISDLTLRENDVISIPYDTGTVSIKGEVLYPNTVVFVKGKPLKYYINQSGGFNNEAKSSKVYVIYMNGSVNEGLGSSIEPGCEIIVPKKRETKPLSATEIMSLGTSTASLSTMVVSLVNMLKK